MDIAFIEGCSPKGHVTLNNFYLKELEPNTRFTFIGKSLKNDYLSLKNISYFDDSSLKKSRFIHAMTFCKNSLAILLKLKRNNVSNVCFLSYDLATFFIVCLFARLLSVKLFTFEHNTVPGNKKTKHILHKLCINNVVHICYTSQAKQKFNLLNKKAVFIPHPAIIQKVSGSSSNSETKKFFNNNKMTVFCPSASSDIKLIEQRINSHPDIQFIIKSPKSFAQENVIAKKLYNDYWDILQNCNFVYLPINIEDRVSGPFYEALASGKQIILSESQFYHYANKKFTGSIILDTEAWKLPPQKNNSFDHESYNNSIVKSLESVFFKENCESP